MDERLIQGLRLISVSLVAFVLLVLLWALTYAAALTAWLGPESVKGLALILGPARLLSRICGLVFLVLSLVGKIKCRQPEGPGKTELLLATTFDIIAGLLCLTPLGGLAAFPVLASALLFLAYLFRLGSARDWTWLQNQSKAIGLLIAAAYGVGLIPGVGPLIATLTAVGSAAFLFKLLKRTAAALEAHGGEKIGRV